LGRREKNVSVLTYQISFLGRREKKGFSSEIPNFIFGQEGKKVSVLK
jgi:hypothetical protein